MMFQIFSDLLLFYKLMPVHFINLMPSLNQIILKRYNVVWKARLKTRIKSNLKYEGRREFQRKTRAEKSTIETEVAICLILKVCGVLFWHAIFNDVYFIKFISIVTFWSTLCNIYRTISESFINSRLNDTLKRLLDCSFFFILPFLSSYHHRYFTSLR